MGSTQEQCKGARTRVGEDSRVNKLVEKEAVRKLKDAWLAAILLRGLQSVVARPGAFRADDAAIGVVLEAARNLLVLGTQWALLGNAVGVPGGARTLDSKGVHEGEEAKGSVSWMLNED